MHDPIPCVKQLRQTLAADKLSVGFFLGAGCPCSIRVPRETGCGDAPLVPDIEGLTGIVAESLSANPATSEAFATLKGTFERDGHLKPNVEELLSRIRILREAAGTDSARGLQGADLDSLDYEICQTIANTANRALPSDSTPYHALGRMARGYRTPPLEIFTTNYDLLTEQALESLHVPFFDGFVGSDRPFFDQRAIEDDVLPERWARLWKLHGSINWRFDNETRQISRSVVNSDGDDLLIHPSHRKYDESRRMPYVVMIDRLKTFLRKDRRPVALFVIGHSFSDEHLNATLMESLRANPSAACFALQFRELSTYPMALRLARDEPGLTILASDRAVVRAREAPWLFRPLEETDELSGVFELKGDDEDDENGSTAVGHQDVDRDADGRRMHFALGDFRAFGHFLDGVTGHGL